MPGQTRSQKSKLLKPLFFFLIFEKSESKKAIMIELTVQEKLIISESIRQEHLVWAATPER